MAGVRPAESVVMILTMSPDFAFRFSGNSLVLNETHSYR